jgi:hypothetical protein
MNLGLAFIVFPAYMLLSNYFTRYLLGDYSSFSGTFWGFTKVILSDAFRGECWWLLLGVLLPYNTVVYYYKQLKGKEIRLVYKMIIFVLIESFTFVVVGGGKYFFASLPVTLTLLLFFSTISLVVVSVHEYIIEKKEVDYQSSE